jgi:hypothetical protein
MPYKFIKNDVFHTVVKEMPKNKYSSSMYALKRRKETKTTDPIANPFVVAFVVLPTTSSKSIIFLTFFGYGHNDKFIYLVLNNTFGKTHCELQKNDERKKDLEARPTIKSYNSEGFVVRQLVVGCQRLSFITSG